MLALMLMAGGGGAAILAWRLGAASAGRNDAPAGNAAVIRGYWIAAAVLGVAGIASLF